MSSRLSLACSWMLAVLVGVLVPCAALAQERHQAHGKPPAAHHSARAHAKPPPHARAKPKKKRPTVPQKKAAAKHRRPTLKAKIPQTGPRVPPKPNHETFTPIHRVPPATLTAQKVNPPVNDEVPSKDRELRAEPDAPVAPVSPAVPRAPEVPEPKAPPAASE